ncbi:DUF3862 domain-containing protein [Clostridium sp. UBA1652]|uniref:DUF3862 domain-containing protein n=1 Tax=Clostridium sp. UBA1652 TaxID=1946348 RepID=UPI00257BB998|nr:DUF3862 domain-containing protein [Clostridium sp. UBA1652]
MVKKNERIKKVLLGIGMAGLLTFSMAVLSGCSSSKPANSTSDSSTVSDKEPEKKEPEKAEGKISYDNFLKINMGMSYDEVKAILGEGEEKSSSEAGGLKTTMYAWKGDGLTSINITIQNDITKTKSQLGLVSSKADVNMDKYNKVNNGMSYDEVKGILDEGVLISEGKIMNSDSTMYSWVNKNGSNMNVTFSDGKVSSKSQLSLK